MVQPLTKRIGTLALSLLGVCAIAPFPHVAAAQGRCGGDRAGTPACDTMPAKAPFAPTGWKTVALDHFAMRAADYKKEAAYYATLMNWKVRSDDGTQAVLDAGDVGRIIIRGGYQAPPPPPPPTAADSAAGRARLVRPPRNVVWDSFCWVIAPWDAKKVEAALRERGLAPVADIDGAGFQSFHVKDPDGFDVQVSNGAHRRGGQPASAPLPAAAPFDKTAWQTVWLDHISFGVTNYKESVAFYRALLGWTSTGDEGSQSELWIGDLGNIIVRGGNPNAPGAAPAASRRAQIDHVSFGISPWDTDGVKAELDRRGLTGRADTGGKGDIHDPAALYKSYHTTTPSGFDLQISNATKTNRTVR
jgi:catechol 2,3-dioxygenase-like lactoylglutathione lyase family enzyme